jgi:hypothetical protein
VRNRQPFLQNRDYTTPPVCSCVRPNWLTFLHADVYKAAVFGQLAAMRRSFVLILEDFFVCRPEKPDHEHDKANGLDGVDLEDGKNM